jgi:hypothetical protein
MAFKVFRRTADEVPLFFTKLAGPAFLQVLQKVTNMWGLMPDPYMFGGGLHATASGGKLAVHADYNKHPFFKLDRRLNLLIYLNEGWKEENGGCLELWDREMKGCAKRVLPEFNQTVLFATDSSSFHGQPEPVVGPPGLWRKSSPCTTSRMVGPTKGCRPTVQGNTRHFGRNAPPPDSDQTYVSARLQPSSQPDARRSTIRRPL